MNRFLLVFALICTAAGAIIVGLVLNALAHDAPTGWSYPTNCCSNYDCRVVGDGGSDAKVKVLETQQGYVISSTNEVIGYSDPKVKPSPDGEFHWCSTAGTDTGKTICLFVPPRGM